MQRYGYVLLAPDGEDFFLGVKRHLFKRFVCTRTFMEFLSYENFLRGYPLMLNLDAYINTMNNDHGGKILESIELYLYENGLSPLAAEEIAMSLDFSMVKASLPDHPLDDWKECRTNDEIFDAIESFDPSKQDADVVYFNGDVSRWVFDD